MLALTPSDLDFEKGMIRVNKTYKRRNRHDVVTTPKTDKSNRIISMPKFLAEELQDCLKMLYGIKRQIAYFQAYQYTVCTVKWNAAQRKQALNALGFMTSGILTHHF